MGSQDMHLSYRPVGSVVWEDYLVERCVGRMEMTNKDKEGSTFQKKYFCDSAFEKDGTHLPSEQTTCVYQRLGESIEMKNSFPCAQH
ncbi:hypothetical protein NPIL_365991 [Nephila pilipes]|uniref:Uncharacterized protein n=1 Tax=Nephila pilipes TaxID=299642 RepID=A0A8X6U8W2_NEPPI|nr:hypothetical protein NPIL_365991 [Nephila pilipes]